jgi:hypothetical protein
MDPDAIFIILLYIIFFILTIGSIIGLSKKIWNSSFSKTVKFLFVGIPIIFLIIALQNFNGDAASVIWIIEIIIFPSLLIGLNWSINIIRRQPYEKINLPKNLKIFCLTILFSSLLLSLLYLVGNFFDWLNLMGSSG